MQEPIRESDETLAAIAELAARHRLRHIQLIAWRDLDDPTAGGSEIHINAVAARWAAAGLDVALRTGSVPGQPTETTRNGVRVTRRGGKLGVWPRTIAAAVRGRDGPVDARVEVWHGVSFFAPLWSRVPTVGIFHHVHSDQFRLVLPPGLAQTARFLERRVYPRLYRNSPLVTLSESVRQQMIDQLAWPADPLRVVEPGVDERFVPGVRSETPLVVSGGRFMPQKRYGDAIEVLVATKRRHPELRAVITGDGPDRAALLAKIDALGVGDWIELPGWVAPDRLLELYQQAWVLLSASHKEGWGMTVTEAGACATPAVATDIAGHRSAVIDGHTGLLATTIDDLTAALTSLIGDHERRARLGNAARRHAQTYTWNRTALRIFEILAAKAGERDTARAAGERDT